MDYVFIDTSIFIENNFFDGVKIKQLLKLGEKEQIKILITRIVYRELISNLNEDVNTALSSFKSFKNKAKVLRNVEGLTERFNTIEFDRVKESLINKLDRVIANSKVEILDYPTNGIDKVFDNYFSNIFPFDKRDKKKNEFPDAFSLLAIENYCKSNDILCKVLSKDADLINYKSHYLLIYKDYEEFLDSKLKELANKDEQPLFELVKRYIEQNHNDIDAALKYWLDDNLDDETLYINEADSEILHIEVMNIEVHFEKYNLISVEQNELVFEIETYIECEVHLLMNDYDSAYYDDVEEAWQFTATTTKIITKYLNIPVEVLADVPENMPFPLYTQVVEINNGKRLRK